METRQTFSGGERGAKGGSSFSSGSEGGVSREIGKRFLEGSLTLDSVNAMIEKESDIQSKLLSCMEKIQYLNTIDLLVISKFTQGEIEGHCETLELFNII